MKLILSELILVKNNFKVKFIFGNLSDFNQINVTEIAFQRESKNFLL